MIKDGPFLDAEWKCRVCKKLPGEHPVEAVTDFEARVEAAVKRAIRPLAKEVAYQKRRRYDHWTRSNATAIRTQEQNLVWKTALPIFTKMVLK